MNSEKKPTPRLVTGADDTAVADLPPARKGNRRRLLIIALPLALMLGGSYAWMTGGRYIETEDAWTSSRTASTSCRRSAARFASTAVAENETVAAGQTLFTLDDATYRSAVEAAKARLASARLEVERLKAAYAQAVAEAATARELLATTRTQDDRQQAVEVRRGQPVRRRRQRAEAAGRQGRRGQGRERGRLRPRGARRRS